MALPSDRAVAATPSSPAVSPVPASIPSAVGSYLTCRNCGIARNTCARRAEVRERIKGLGLTSIKFRCVDRVPVYRPGQRVSVTWPYYPPDWAYEDGVSLETWPATIVQETKKGFLIAVDDVPSDNDLPAREYIKSDSLYCNVTAGKLSPLDEPERRICSYCHNVESSGGAVPGCYAANEYDVHGTVRIDNCLAQGIAARSDETAQQAQPAGQEPGLEGAP